MLAVVVIFIKQFTLLVVESCLGELRAALVIGSSRVACFASFDGHRGRAAA
jgi:hypothetical protein